MNESIVTMQNRLKSAGIIAIIRGNFDPGFVRELAAVLVDNNVVALEMTLNSKGVLELIPRLRNLVGARGCVGVGTVRQADQVDVALDAGAQFIVSPNFDRATTETAAERGVLHLPGVLTPTEIQDAVNAGCKMVKLFPASAMGPGYLRAVRRPLDDVDLVAVGGIDAQNVDEFILAGAAAVGVGSTLVQPDRSLEEIGWRAAALHEALEEARA